jgi:hypothetical protein
LQQQIEAVLQDLIHDSSVLARRLASAFASVFVFLYWQIKSKVSTSATSALAVLEAPDAVSHVTLDVRAQRQYLYFCTSKASKLQ